MTDFAYPTAKAFKWASFSARLRPNVVVSTSPHDASVQTVESPGSRWLFALTYPPQSLDDRAAVEAYWNRVRGMVNRVTMFHLTRPVPRGTMRGSPVLSATAAFGAQSLAITTTANATLKAGDLIKVGAMLVMVVEDAAASAGGAMTVNITPPLRAQVASGQAVTWDHPTTRFISTSNEIEFAYTENHGPAFAVELMEVF